MARLGKKELTAKKEARRVIANKIAKDSGMQSSLDVMIHDMFSQQAANLNNSGPEAQLEYLENDCGMDLDEIWDGIKD